MQKSSPNTVIYAIGDIHGEAERLKQMHDNIFERHNLLFPDQDKMIIHLGDYVDRGPDSAGVIEQIMALEARPDLSVINLRGNHEAMMLDGLSDAFPTARSHWLKHGGAETLMSYEEKGHARVPNAHIDWLARCPFIHIERDRKMIFVHAGIDPEKHPEQTPEVYLWTRSPRFFDAASWSNRSLFGWTVIHGHTPTKDGFPETAQAHAGRINLDTGAVYGGRLTAGIFAPGAPVSYIYA